MVQFAIKSTALLAFVVLAQGAPVFKRIAQNTVDSKTQWEAACNKAGGAGQCNPIAVNAIGTLLAAADPCAQQNSADQMIDLAKQLNNDADMIKLAQIFAQQPRNSPDSLSVPYCQQAPKNQELNGLFQCQFQGVNPKTFSKNVAVGQAGTIPFGQNQPLNPAGSCPAHPDGPIPDGQQLVDIVGGASGSSGAGANTNTGSGNGASSAPDPTTSVPPTNNSGGAGGDNDDCDDTVTATVTQAPAATTTPSVNTSTGNSANGDFRAQNAKDAQALNAKFTSLTKDSACNDGESACVEGGFAQCVGGKFTIMPCAGGTQCFALPLVNKPGTSLTCDTKSDADARITQAGGSGDINGN